MTPEGQIKKNICEYLEKRPDCFFWVQESVGQFDRKIGKFRRKNSKYQKNGIPDILCFLKIDIFPPVMIGFEVKAPGRKQTDSQIEFERDYKRFGGFYFVVRNVESVTIHLFNVKKLVKSMVTIKN